MAHEAVFFDAALGCIGGEAHEARVESMRNRLLYSLESAAADKEDIFSVYGYHGLLGMLAAALGRNIYH